MSQPFFRAEAQRLCTAPHVCRPQLFVRIVAPSRPPTRCGPAVRTTRGEIFIVSVQIAVLRRRHVLQTPSGSPIHGGLTVALPRGANEICHVEYTLYIFPLGIYGGDESTFFLATILLVWYEIPSNISSVVPTALPCEVRFFGLYNRPQNQSVCICDVSCTVTVHR